MYVYIWKHPDGVPFYVGYSRSKRRTDPKASQIRGWFCKQTLATVGPENVVVELRPVSSTEDGQQLERELIAKFGRISLGTGTLTNLRIGGEGTETMSEKGKNALRERLRQKPLMADPEIKKRAIIRMKEAAQRRRGDANSAKRPEVRAKIKANWAKPEFKEKMRVLMQGKKRNISEERRMALRERALDEGGKFFNSHIRLNSDPDIACKRAATLATDSVRQKISAGNKAAWASKTPEQRGAQLRGTRAPKSEEAKRKISEAAKLRWAKKKMSSA